MPIPLVTFTTDFGTGSSYVAAMKGVVLGLNPDAHLVDLTHDIPPQDLCVAAFFLAATIPQFPADAIHVIVVDPGVGTERALLCANLRGHRLLVPDNGCWCELARRIGDSVEVIRLTEPKFWRPTVSSTFHGRDILAPVAGHLSLGIDSRQLGPTVNQWVDLKLPQPRISTEGLVGEVLFVDHFGNLITNIPASSLKDLKGQPLIRVGECKVERHVRAYGEVEPGTLVSLVSSFDLLEIAQRNGNASARLNAGVGTPVVVSCNLAVAR
jgi:S-adenosylmethionine hydrolase